MGLSIGRLIRAVMVSTFVLVLALIAGMAFGFIFSYVEANVFILPILVVLVAFGTLVSLFY